MIHILMSLLGISLASIVFFLVRRDHLHASHGAGWVGVAVLCLLLGFSPILFDAIAQFIGVKYPPILAVIFAVGMVLVKLLLMDLASTRTEVRLIRITQKLAMLEEQLDSVLGRDP